LTDVLLSLLKIVASIGLLGVVLALAARWAPIARAPAEIRRKFIHVSLGAYCLLLPVIFEDAWEVWLACALTVGVFMLARGRLRATLGCGLHAVGRESLGEVYFACAVALLFALRDSAPAALGGAAYVLPLAVLTISDTAAALVGRRFGRLRFAVGDGSKSWEGVLAFSVSAWLVSFAALTLLTALDPVRTGALSLAAAAVGAAVEAASTRGADNLLLPIALYGVTSLVLEHGFDWILIATSIMAAAIVLALLAAPHRSMAR